MLPPVLASPSSYTPATEARPRVDQVAVAPLSPATTSKQTTSGELSPNATISGQLNIMMLSGPERMSQNLATLAEVLGSALKIERRADEALSDYMARLIEGIAALPAGDRLKLQKLLTQVFAGLQLRTLLDAMSNPYGPERATLALYLELYREPNKDGATRSAISSYREMAAEGRTNNLPPARLVSANDSLRQSNERIRQDLRPLPPAPPGAVIVGQDAEPLEGPSSGSTAPTRTATPATAAQPGAAGATAQSRLMNAADPEAQPAVLTKVADSRLAAEERQQGAPPVPTTSTPDKGRAKTSDPTVPRSDDRPLESTNAAKADGEATENRAPSANLIMPQPAAVGSKPVQPLPLAWMAELMESNIVRTLLQLKTLSAGQPVELPPGDRARRSELETNALPPGPPAEASASEIDEAPIPTAQAGSRQPLPEDHPLPPSVIPVEQAIARPLTAREGVPLPFILYAIEDEIRTDPAEAEEDEREDDKGRRRQGDEEAAGEDGEPSAQDGTMMVVGEREETTQLDPARALNGQDALRPAIPALNSPTDTPVRLPLEPAHELYLRMAGLN